MALLHMDNPRFKRAVFFSILAHITLFLAFFLSPYIPDFSKKRTIYYVDFMGGGGGGNGGNPGASLETEADPPEEVAETTSPPRETLKDLTVPDNLQAAEPKLRHPVDNPKRETKKKPQKKAVIQKAQPNPASKKASSQGTGIGTGGVSLGGVGTGSGSGSGSGFGPGTGMGNFPFAYYFEQIIGLVAQNWYTYQVRSGISGNLSTVITFRINRDGSTGDIKVTESSGMSILDSSAMKAVQNSRFPRLPPALDEDYIIINLLFEHKR